MDMSKAVAVGVVLIGAFLVFWASEQHENWVLNQSSGCHFAAIYNFGDSNSDTGGRSAAFNQILSPYGNTHFGKPSGRLSDGRVIIDFIAEKLGLPDLAAYLDSVGTNFRHGANFATAGSTIQPVDGRMFEGKFSPFSLDIQLQQFEQLISRSKELYSEATSAHIRSSLPRPEELSKALYTFDIGQNDLHAGLRWTTEEQVQASIPDIINQFAMAVERLYQHGARNFWIHNTCPIGCLPLTLMYTPPKPDNLDQNGCVKSYNEVAQEFNRQLKKKVSKLRAQLPDAMLTYVDIYSAKYALISEAIQHGFVDPLGYCCGQYENHHVQCGMKSTVDGTEVYGTSCGNPSAYISWDGIHYTHAANMWIAERILNDSYSDPPTSITEACHKPVYQQ